MQNVPCYVAQVFHSNHLLLACIPSNQLFMTTAVSIVCCYLKVGVVFSNSLASPGRCIRWSDHKTTSGRQDFVYTVCRIESVLLELITNEKTVILRSMVVNENDLIFWEKFVVAKNMLTLDFFSPVLHMKICLFQADSVSQLYTTNLYHES